MLEALFQPLPMQRIHLQVMREDASRAALALAELGIFHPEPTGRWEERLPEQPGARYREVYREAQGRFDKLWGLLGDAREDLPPDGPPREVPIEELVALNMKLGRWWHEVSALEEQTHRLEDERHAKLQLLASLERFGQLDIDLSRLQERRRFLDLHLGTVPLANLRRLRESLGLSQYLVQSFREVADLAHVVVVGPSAEERDEVRGLLAAAGFVATPIPKEFRDRPETVHKELDARLATITDELKAVEGQIKAFAQVHRDELLQAWRALTWAAPLAFLSPTLRAMGGLALIHGWMPKDRVREADQALHRYLKNPYVLESRDPQPEERWEVPSALRHRFILRPFATLVKNYGIPRYGEVDPTLLFAVTFIAMFGMMFGDIGHGLTIALGGWLLRGKLKSFTPFVMAAGVASTLFGWMYGSIFGFEEIVEPLWISPLSDPMLMLMVALYWGIGFIVVATMLTIRNRLVERRWGEALFDGKGLAGLALYLGGLESARAATLGRFGMGEALAMAIPLLVILTYGWNRSSSRGGEKLLVVGIEGFETVMGFIANTLSFLRVAAFSLNHVALAVAVFTLAEMMGSTGHWVTVVLGNLFILVLEGGIVAIQVLRLEYYEGFSRFFQGDGKEFKPLVLGR